MKDFVKRFLRSLVEKMAANKWNTAIWILCIIFSPVIVPALIATVLVGAILVYSIFNPDFGASRISRDYVAASEYRTVEDFYKLTGVEFPELKLVDSLYFDGGFLSNGNWSEYKFVAQDTLDDEFYKRLDNACIADSTHWNLWDSEPLKVGEKNYQYWIYPDKEPVDRSRGMCDRMAENADGELVPDWDGIFISVEVQSDTIILKSGWLR